MEESLAMVNSHITTLSGMGFSSEMARRALEVCGYSLARAATALLEGTVQAPSSVTATSTKSPPSSSSSSSRPLPRQKSGEQFNTEVRSQAVATLLEMGFNQAQARAALLKHGFNVERAAASLASSDDDSSRGLSPTPASSSLSPHHDAEETPAPPQVRRSNSITVVKRPNCRPNRAARPIGVKVPGSAARSQSASSSSRRGIKPVLGAIPPLQRQGSGTKRASGRLRRAAEHKGAHPDIKPGAQVEVYWSGDGKWYAATVESCNHVGSVTVRYPDGGQNFRSLRLQDFRAASSASDALPDTAHKFPPFRFSKKHGDQTAGARSAGVTQRAVGKAAAARMGAEAAIKFKGKCQSCREANRTVRTCRGALKHTAPYWRDAAAGKGGGRDGGGLGNSKVGRIGAGPKAEKIVKDPILVDPFTGAWNNIRGSRGSCNSGERSAEFEGGDAWGILAPKRFVELFGGDLPQNCPFLKGAHSPVGSKCEAATVGWGASEAKNESPLEHAARERAHPPTGLERRHRSWARGGLLSAAYPEAGEDVDGPSVVELAMGLPLMSVAAEARVRRGAGAVPALLDRLGVVGLGLARRLCAAHLAAVDGAERMGVGRGCEWVPQAKDLPSIACAVRRLVVAPSGSCGGRDQAGTVARRVERGVLQLRIITRLLTHDLCLCAARGLGAAAHSLAAHVLCAPRQAPNRGTSAVAAAAVVVPRSQVLLRVLRHVSQPQHQAARAPRLARALAAAGSTAMDLVRIVELVCAGHGPEEGRAKGGLSVPARGVRVGWEATQPGKENQVPEARVAAAAGRKRGAREVSVGEHATSPTRSVKQRRLGSALHPVAAARTLRSRTAAVRSSRRARPNGR